MRAAALGLAAAVVTAGVVTAAPASADPAANVSNGRVSVTGLGFGHGHGMSQYGAWGAAKRGVTWDKILGYYYPGTALSTTNTRLRVLLTADRGNDTVVKPKTGLKVRDTKDGATWTLPRSGSITHWRIKPLASSPSVSKVQYRSGGKWRRWALPGRTNLRGEGEFRATGAVRLVLPGGSSRVYRESLRNARTPSGGATRGTLNVIGVDKYVRGVVAAEMPSSWHYQALRAQAVAARTYAVFLQRSRTGQWYHACDTTSCQVYGGVSREAASTDAAVAATRGRILTYGGKPAFTQFSSSSGGWSLRGSQPYLRSKPDAYDPATPWRASLSAATAQRAYPKIGTLRSVQVMKRDGNGRWGGRVTTLRLHGSKTSVSISGERARWLFGLRSTWFTAS